MHTGDSYCKNTMRENVSEYLAMPDNTVLITFSVSQYQEYRARSLFIKIPSSKNSINVSNEGSLGTHLVEQANFELTIIWMPLPLAFSDYKHSHNSQDRDSVT